MNKIEKSVKYHIGPRTLFKSYRAFHKCKVGRNGRGIGCFLLNGDLDVNIESGAIVENRGIFQFGIKCGLEPSKGGQFILGKQSKLIIDGVVAIGSGVKLHVNNKAVLKLDDVRINCDTNIICDNQISIGKGTMIAWNVEILDSDRHRIIREDFEVSKPITIGAHVWVGARAIILKGVTIGSGSVIACGAIVTRDVPENCLAMGVPAKVVKSNIHWGD